MNFWQFCERIAKELGSKVVRANIESFYAMFLVDGRPSIAIEKYKNKNAKEN